MTRTARLNRAHPRARNVSAPLLALEEGDADAAPQLWDRASILFPAPLPEPFDYKAPSAWGLQPGAQVIAPLGPRLLHGVVWRLEPGAQAVDNLRAVEEFIPAPPVPEVSRRFVDWIAKYVVAQPGAILRLVLRSSQALRPSPTYAVYAPAPGWEGALTPQRARVLKEAESEAVTAAELARRAEVSPGVVKALIEAGALQRLELPEDPLFDPPDPHQQGAVLSPSQAAAAEKLQAQLAAGGFQAALLDGVTGSGKTEIYFEAIAAALAADPKAQALVLLPEIALTQAIIARIKARFGAEPVEWHSGISQKARRRAYREIIHGRARLVVGARSALFLPYPNLRVIVVDEEHDPSYKQDDGVAYQARDLAVARAKLGECLVVLASATPSLETLVNAQSGRYAHIKLETRHGAAVLPDVALIDMREDAPERGKWLSPVLVRATAEALARGEQALFYLNRRGYAPLTLCRACGHRMESPETQSWLVEHRYTGRLVCHLTGFSMPKPRECPNCMAPETLTAIGPGVERVEEEAKELFPQARVEVFSSDTAADPQAVRDLVARMAQGEIDILVGTQIVAKGHNFPLLTIVGVVDADLGLKGGDLRAGERTFQLLSQVAGRAGRADRPGRAFVQTYAPEHEAMQCLARHDRDGFLAVEAIAREQQGMPPYGRLAALILAAPNAQAADLFANALGAAAPNAAGIDVWGPAPAPLAVIGGQHRRRFLIRAERHIDLSGFVAAWLSRWKQPNSARLQIDIDPYSFL